jgi:hypothetical protein
LAFERKGRPKTRNGSCLRTSNDGITSGLDDTSTVALSMPDVSYRYRPISVVPSSPSSCDFSSSAHALACWYDTTRPYINDPFIHVLDHLLHRAPPGFFGAIGICIWPSISRVVPTMPRARHGPHLHRSSRSLVVERAIDIGRPVTQHEELSARPSLSRINSMNCTRHLTVSTGGNHGRLCG